MQSLLFPLYIDHKYESGLDPPSGMEATLTGTVTVLPSQDLGYDLVILYVGGGDDIRELVHTTNEELSMPVLCTPTSSCPSSVGQSWLQVGGFCEKPEDQMNDDELCKTSPLLIQGIKIMTFRSKY